MKKRLETAKDFKKAFNALNDPDTTPEQYIFNTDFGFCVRCEDVTEYEGHFGPEESHLKCLSCHYGFVLQSVKGTGPVYVPDDYSWNLISNINVYFTDTEKLNDPQVSQRVECILSREGQRELLLELLNRRVEVEANKVANLRDLLRKHSDELYELDVLLTAAEQ
ncbi:MAG: hypothetical protein WDZ39_01370 [Candidatus Spechtbacterales bacterium]